MQARSPRPMTAAVAMLAASAAILPGCASSPSSQSAGYVTSMGAAQRGTAPLPGKPGCFWLSNFDGSWTVLNDSELIVYAPLHSRPYLIRLFEPVPDLRFHQRLGFEADEHTGMICDRSMDDLVVPRWQPHRIPIAAVHELTAPEAKRLLAENHISPRPGSKPVRRNQTANR